MHEQAPIHSLSCCIHVTRTYNILFPVVDVFQSQDRSVCYGMMATVTCVTTTMNGRLQWVIDNAPVFTVTSGRTDNFNETTDGSEFVFVRGILESGVYVYTSTVSLNTNQTTSIRCLDGSIPQTLDVNLVGKLLQSLWHDLLTLIGVIGGRTSVKTKMFSVDCLATCTCRFDLYTAGQRGSSINQRAMAKPTATLYLARVLILQSCLAHHEVTPALVSDCMLLLPLLAAVTEHV